MTSPPPALSRAVLSCIACVVLLGACARKEGPAGAGAPPPMPVTTVRVHRHAVPIALEAVGQAEGSREVEIRARVNGILDQRLYEEGAPVKAGDALFVIDPAPYELAVQDAKAALQQEQVRRELARTDAARLEPLAREKAISQRELDQALATEKQSTAAIASAQAKLNEAELNLSYTRVTAPIGGVSGRALRSEGTLVTANSDTAMLTTLTQVNPIWVRFPLAEGDYARVRGGQRHAGVQPWARTAPSSPTAAGSTSPARPWMRRRARSSCAPSSPIRTRGGCPGNSCACASSPGSSRRCSCRRRRCCRRTRRAS